MNTTSATLSYSIPSQLKFILISLDRIARRLKRTQKRKLPTPNTDASQTSGKPSF
jgi:hypothetical protein